MRIRRPVGGTAGIGLVGVALVALGEIVEGGQRLFGVLALAEHEGIEADAIEEEDLVAADVAEGAQFAVVAVALAQQAGGGVAAAVGELREMHGDHGEVVDVGGDVGDLRPPAPARCPAACRARIRDGSGRPSSPSTPRPAPAAGRPAGRRRTALRRRPGSRLSMRHPAGDAP
jgi:hypothetical protein